MSMPPLVILLESWDKRFETEELDEFRELVATSVSRQQKAIEHDKAFYSELEFEDENDVQSYKMHLDDRDYFTSEVQHLANELSIMALLKQLELHIKRVVKKRFPSVDEKQLFKIAELKKLLPFNVNKLHCFGAFDELRLINNAIKHEGKVSNELAISFPSWKVGEDLTELGTVYTRLQPEVVLYVQAFVAACYAHSVDATLIAAPTSTTPRQPLVFHRGSHFQAIPVDGI